MECTRNGLKGREEILMIPRDKDEMCVAKIKCNELDEPWWCAQVRLPLFSPFTSTVLLPGAEGFASLVVTEPRFRSDVCVEQEKRVQTQEERVFKWVSRWNRTSEEYISIIIFRG